MYEKFIKLRDEARLAGDKVRLELFKIILSHSESAISATSKKSKISDDIVLKVINSLFAGNKEIIAARPERTDLVAENIILEEFIPKLLSFKETEKFLYTMASKLSDFENEGQAIGFAVKATKDMDVNKKFVAQIVREIREGEINS